MKQKITAGRPIPGFEESQEQMDPASRAFVDKSMAIGHYVQVLLKDQGLKQKDLAELMGKSEAEISKWLTGVHNYTMRTLSKLEAALGSDIVFVPAHLGQTEFISNDSRKKSNVLMTQSQREAPTAPLAWELSHKSKAKEQVEYNTETNSEELWQAA